MDPAKQAEDGWNTILEAHLGSTGATLAWTLGAVAAAIFGLVFKRYVDLLGCGGAEEGSDERRDYDGLRSSLAEGGTMSQVYGRMLARFIAGVDRFFGDADKAHLSAFPRAFGLNEPAPLWTGAAYDRCLFLAQIYPIVLIFAIWAVSGHVGPAEQALGLVRDDARPWARPLLVASLTLALFSFWKYNHIASWTRWLWLSVAFVVTVIAAGGFPVAVAVAGAGGFTVAVTGTAVGAVTVAGAGIVAGAVAFSAAFVIAATFPGAFAGAFAFAVELAAFVRFATGTDSQGTMLTAFSAIMATIFLACADQAGSLGQPWKISGPLWLFLGLLNVINAPFDWISLGVTRALLRLGVQKRGWWPYILAFVDVVLALGVLVLLAAAMVVGVQAFDDLAVRDNADAILPLAPLFDGMAEHPEAPEYFWVYATLFSTLIPSLFNLVMGAWSLTRGLPFLSRWMAQAMPIGRPPARHNRVGIAAFLTLQWAIGFVLAIVATWFSGWGVWKLFPSIGHDFLDLARGLVALDLPGRIGL